MHTADEILIDQLRSPRESDSQRGWVEIYKHCFPTVRKVILRNNGSEQDAIDIFQDGLMVFNRNLKTGRFRGESSIKTYIFSICKNLWLKEIQKKQKQAAIDPYLMQDSREDLSYLENVEIVSELMGKLQEDCRKILIEYYYNNKSMRELKDIFNVNSIQAAKNKKWRCLSYLVKLFKEKGITSTEMVNHE